MLYIEVFFKYFVDIIPILLMGFLLSGIIHELIPDNLIEKYLGSKGIKGVVLSTIVGAIIPVCCWGSLPIAVSFYRKGASLGAVLAMLVATPATSITAFMVTVKFLGLGFAVYLFFSVILMGIVIGLIGNKIKLKPKEYEEESESCCHSNGNGVCGNCETERASFFYKIKSIFKYAFVIMPKEIGLWIILGIVLASIVKVSAPVEYFITNYITGIIGYIFAAIVAVVTYTCATASVPLVHAFITKGLDIGPAFVLLLVGPITSYGTILVLRKEFGVKLICFYLGLISVLAIVLGVVYSLL